jgi:prevent-host-death family protein
MAVSRKFSVAEVKATLSERIREAEHGDSVVITRRGRPVAAIVSAPDLEKLRRLRAAGPAGGLASIAGGWEGSDELAEEVAGLSRSGVRVWAEPD